MIEFRGYCYIALGNYFCILYNKTQEDIKILSLLRF